MVIKNGNGTSKPSRKGCRYTDAEIEVLMLPLALKLPANIQIYLCIFVCARFREEAEIRRGGKK